MLYADTKDISTWCVYMLYADTKDISTWCVYMLYADTKDSFITNRDLNTNSPYNFVVQARQTGTRESREAVSAICGGPWESWPHQYIVCMSLCFSNVSSCRNQNAGGCYTLYVWPPWITIVSIFGTDGRIKKRIRTSSATVLDVRELCVCVCVCWERLFSSCKSKHLTMCFVAYIMLCI
jgi:hypothetical protein